MPVRSLTSSVLRWPDKETVERAVRRWAQALAQQHPEILRVGYFGSYARGDWGVGSDLDLILVVSTPSAKTSFSQDPTWSASELPVPADVFLYTEEEWQALRKSARRFARVLQDEVVWVFVRE